MLERVTRFMEEKSTDGGSWAANNQLLGGTPGLTSASVNTLWMLKKSCSMTLSSFMFPPYRKLLLDQWEPVTSLCWAGYVSFVPSFTLVGELFNTVVSFSDAKWVRLRWICLCGWIQLADQNKSVERNGVRKGNRVHKPLHSPSF